MVKKAKTIKKSIKKEIKKAAKKTNKKKTAAKSAAKLKLKTINPENYFYMGNGSVIKDLLELADCLENMSHDEFFYHVNDEKNDFANWIRNTLEEPGLADQIIEIQDPVQTQIIILKHLAKNEGKQ